jgi:hypothetical protein
MSLQSNVLPVIEGTGNTEANHQVDARSLSHAIWPLPTRGALRNFLSFHSAPDLWYGFVEESLCGSYVLQKY